MKKYFLRLSPKITLVLSLFLVLLSLGYLWTATGYAMPTPELALRKAEAEEGVPRGEVLARLETRQALGGSQDVFAPWGDLCLFTRSDNGLSAFFTSRTAGLLWDSSVLMPLSDHPLLLAFIHHDTVQNGQTVADGVTLLTAVRLPDAARVALTQGLWPGPTQSTLAEAEYLEQYGVTVDCAELAPGSGVWIGTQDVPPPPGEVTGYTYSSVVRAYDADGALIYISPDADP